jgi:hypothetical protein
MLHGCETWGMIIQIRNTLQTLFTDYGEEQWAQDSLT